MQATAKISIALSLVSVFGLCAQAVAADKPNEIKSLTQQWPLLPNPPVRHEQLLRYAFECEDLSWRKIDPSTISISSSAASIQRPSRSASEH
jgi:hypothetical protein